MNYNKVLKIVHQAKKFVFDDKMKSEVKVKGEADFVTAVDLNISNFVKDELYKLYPEISFMTEEAENKELSEVRWILDPIDGTTNLLFDYRLSSISLALMKNGEIVFGAVYNPYSNETFTAKKGKGAFVNGKKLQVSQRAVKNSLIEFGAGSTRKNETDIAFELGKAVFRECLDIRRICSSALAICYIAAARIDGYFEKKIKPWDYAAASLILSESGGFASNWKGEKLQFDDPSSFIAGNKNTYSFLLEKVKGYI